MSRKMQFFQQLEEKMIFGPRSLIDTVYIIHVTMNSPPQIKKQEKLLQGVYSSVVVPVSLVTIGQVVCQIFPDIAHPLLLLFCSVSWLEVDQLDQRAPDVHAEPWHRWQLLWSILDGGHLVSVQLW